MNRPILVIVLILSAGVSTYGYPEGYGPFERGELTDKVMMRECVLLSPSEQKDKQPAVMSFAESRNLATPVVVLRRTGTEYSYRAWCVTITGNDGKPMSAATTNNSPSDFITVYTADLNQDGQPDFVVNIYWYGCGLNATGSTITFLLSSNGWYVSSSFLNYDFGPEDIVRFNPKGPYYYISNDFFRTENDETRDGRRHNFWVYQLYRFSGCRMIKANKENNRFPKWVWYSFKDNHSETDLLTPDKKRRLLGASESR
jgi:hypothetical protein